jgi:hypothetical protein
MAKRMGAEILRTLFLPYISSISNQPGVTGHVSRIYFPSYCSELEIKQAEWGLDKKF